MNKIFTLAALLTAAFAASAAETNDSINVVITDAAKAPRLVLRGADGTFPAESAIDDSNSIVMTLSDYGYIASNVEISTGGFLFYAPMPATDSDQVDWPRSYLGVAPWAEPVIMRYLNPLYRILQSADEAYVPISDGTYDIHYFTRKQQSAMADQYYELFSIVRADDPEPSDQPPHMFLVSPENEAVAIPTTETPGVYEADIVLASAEFKVCYQSQGYYIPAFAFGPDSASEVYSGQTYAMTYGMNTYKPFTLATAALTDDDSDAMLAVGDKAKVRISFAGDVETMTITRIDDPVTTITEISGEQGTGGEWFTVSGIRVPAPGGRHGIYLVKGADGAVAKKIR